MCLRLVSGDQIRYVAECMYCAYVVKTIMYIIYLYIVWIYSLTCLSQIVDASAAWMVCEKSKLVDVFSKQRWLLTSVLVLKIVISEHGWNVKFNNNWCCLSFICKQTLVLESVVFGRINALTWFPHDWKEEFNIIGNAQYGCGDT